MAAREIVDLLERVQIPLATPNLMIKSIFYILVLFLIFSVNAYSEEVYLKNGDRISGEIVEENEERVFIKTDAMDTLSINRRFIEKVTGREEEEIEEAKEEPEIIWGRKVSLGYNKSSGNTDTSQFLGNVSVSRNRKHIDEITLKGDAYYSSSDKNMDAQKWHGSGRYALSFGKEKKWYNFYKLEADHDRFANIDYRLVPSAGMGYWLYDLPELKAMAELSIGSEHTEYRDTTPDSDEVVLIPRGFFEKAIFKNSKISEDIIFYPAVDDFGDYRLHSETVFTTPMNENLSLNISFIDDYDSESATDAKKNDSRIVSSLTYSF